MEQISDTNLEFFIMNWMPSPKIILWFVSLKVWQEKEFFSPPLESLSSVALITHQLRGLIEIHCSEWSVGTTNSHRAPPHHFSSPVTCLGSLKSYRTRSSANLCGLFLFVSAFHPNDCVRVYVFMYCTINQMIIKIMNWGILNLILLYIYNTRI